MKSFFLFLIISLFLFATFTFAEPNFTSTSRGNLNLDESLSSNVEVKYHRPQQILVLHVKPTRSYFLNDTESWLRLFHYYITTRLEFPDMPFNYVVDSSGNIYETIEGSQGRAAYIEGEEGTVVVAYFSESLNFSPSAQRGLRTLIENYSYKFGIPKERVKLADFIISQESSLPSYKLSEGFFQEEFLAMVEDFEYSESPNLRLSAEVRDLDYEDSVNLGERLKVSFLLKNTDTFSWYLDEGLVFLSTVDDQDSEFAINQEWESFSKPLTLESQTVLPGDEIEVSFELETMSVLPGQYSERFKFVVLPDLDVVGSEFEIEFEIQKGDRKIVQIRPTNTGALTVYDCPSHSCEMVAGAISGQRYVVLDEENSWYKISVDGVEGWVTIHYATVVD